MKRLFLLVGCGVSALLLAPPVKADPETHDGFYLHLNLGLGYLTSTAESQGVETSLSGLTVPSTLLLGGSIVPGFVLGGGLFSDYSVSPAATVNGQDFPTGVDAMWLVGIGAFVDIYPDPQNGLHFQGFVGWGGLETSAEGNVGGSDPTGLVTYVGGGYDWWVADQWSIGVMGRLAYAPLSMNDVSFTTIAPAVLATFTYH